jgi:hypothetical protein
MSNDAVGALPVSRLERAKLQRAKMASSAANEGNEQPATSYDTTLRDDDADGDMIMLSPSGRRRRCDPEREIALKRNAARRQKSSDMLGAMRDATRRAPGRSQSSMAAFERKPPPRTKSGEGGLLGDEVEGGQGLAGMSRLRRSSDQGRRAPQRSRTGDGLGPRRPPPRTKSGSVTKTSPLFQPPLTEEST